MLSGGDITKRDDILWGFTPDECLPYIKFKNREVLFREAVMAFIGVEDSERKEKASIEEFCMACKQAKKDDCDNCSKEFKVIENG